MGKSEVAAYVLVIASFIGGYQQNRLWAAFARSEKVPPKATPPPLESQIAAPVVEQLPTVDPVTTSPPAPMLAIPAQGVPTEPDPANPYAPLNNPLVSPPFNPFDVVSPGLSPPAQIPPTEEDPGDEEAADEDGPDEEEEEEVVIDDEGEDVEESYEDDGADEESEEVVEEEGDEIEVSDEG